MVEVSNPQRVVFPDVGKTKAEVVAYYEGIAARALPHLAGRPLSIRRYPKGLAEAGFFQKNVPAHYPASIQRLSVPRSHAATQKHRQKRQQTGGSQTADATIYPVVSQPDHLPYLANQGAIELHVPTSRASDMARPDRLVIDLDPPAGAHELVRQAAQWIRVALEELGLPTVPMATGSKGFHVVAAIEPDVSYDQLWDVTQKLATLVAAAHPEHLTTAYRVAARGERVFLDWLRNAPNATVVAPYSLRARPRASVAAPLSWEELPTTAPDAFGIDDLPRLLERPDTLAELAQRPVAPLPFVQQVERAFDASGLVLEPFDRFRS